MDWTAEARNLGKVHIWVTPLSCLDPWSRKTISRLWPGARERVVGFQPRQVGRYGVTNAATCLHFQNGDIYATVTKTDEKYKEMAPVINC